METTGVRLMAVGDLLIHTEIVNAARRGSDYDFHMLFENMDEIFCTADLLVMNQETLLSDAVPPSGFPFFCSPTAVGRDAQKAGGYVFSLASNHTLDRGAAGLAETMSYWKNQKAAVVGITNVAEPWQPTVVEKNGLRIAFLNYTEPTNCRRNPRSGPWRVELLRSSRREKIARQLEEASRQADFVVVLVHWGVEYLYAPSESQRTWAQFFADHGVGLILGTHPHVLENVSVLTGREGSSVPCFYSLGNFVSCQKRPATMLGGLADVTIVRTASGTAVTEFSLRPLVSHANRDLSCFTVYPLENYTEQLAQENGVFPVIEADYGVKITTEGIRKLYESILDGTAQKENLFQNKWQVLWYNLRRVVKLKLTGGRSAGRV